MTSPSAYASAWPMWRSPEGYGNMSSTYLVGRASSARPLDGTAGVSRHTGSQRSSMRAEVVAVVGRQSAGMEVTRAFYERGTHAADAADAVAV